MHYKDGSQYLGQWKCDCRHGEGFIINTDDIVIEGIWDNDKLVKEIRERVVDYGY